MQPACENVRETHNKKQRQCSGSQSRVDKESRLPVGDALSTSTHEHAASVINVYACQENSKTSVTFTINIASYLRRVESELRNLLEHQGVDTKVTLN